MELQSTVVVAVIIGAVFLSDRIGGSEEMGRRMFQVALGFALALAAVSGTAAFIQEHGQAASLFSSDSGSGSDNSGVNRLVASSAVQVGIAVIFLIFGLGTLQRWATVAIGFIAGGLLLLLAGSANADITTLLYFYSISSGADRAVAVIHFFVVAGAAAGLLWYGLDRYEGVRVGAFARGDDPPDEPYPPTDV